MSSPRSAWLPVLAVLVGACDYDWRLDADVTVPVATQAALSAFPQQVMVRYGRPGEESPSVFRLGVLCAADTAVFAAHLHDEHLGPKCSPVYQVDAWLTWVDPAAGLPCGAWAKAEDLYPCSGPTCAPRAGEPLATALAFGGGCRTADSVSLSVEFPSTATTPLADVP